MGFTLAEDEEIEYLMGEPVGVRKKQKEDGIFPNKFTVDEYGSQDRYDTRVLRMSWARHYMWWIIHNCIAHPIMGILPLKPFFDFHDWTSKMLNLTKIVKGLRSKGGKI